MGEENDVRVYRVWVGKPEGKKLLASCRHRWEDNIKMILQEVVWGDGLDCCGSGQGQVAVTCKYGNEPSVSIKCGEFLDKLKTG
jgi:hypothetical protein